MVRLIVLITRRWRLAARPLPLAACLLLLALLACNLPVSPSPTPLNPPSAISTPLVPSPLPLAPSPSPLPTPTPEPTDLWLGPDDVVLYPASGLYSGDRVSFDVTPHNLGDIPPSDVEVAVYLGAPEEENQIATADVGYPGLDDTARARLTWAWDTTGLAGPYTLTVVLDPDDEIQEGDENPANNAVALTVELWLRDRLPEPEAEATWATARSDCCLFHYLTGTAAERDLAQVTAVAEDALVHVEAALGHESDEPFQVYLIGRVLGQGGYAGEGLVLSYLDRHYAGIGLETVLRHEGTHLLDVTLTDWAPTLIREGLAVYVAGGHYEPEPIPQRAAALLDLGWTIPLDELADDFYHFQHEIGYLEAAALVTFLIEEHGWDRFADFYGSFDAGHESDSEALDAALKESFGAGLAETEAHWLAWLESQEVSPIQARDLQATVRFYDTVRRYQRALDPSAYFPSAWLPWPDRAETEGIVADFLRHPRATENVALEVMLVAADEALDGGDYGRAGRLLDGVDRVLDSGTFDNPLAARYLTVVQAVAAAGYEAQRVALSGDRAAILAIADWPDLARLTLHRRGGGGWVVGDD